jgi:putative transposase
MIFTLWERRHVMKKSRFTEEQIAFAIKQSELGTKVEEICHKMGISDATFYKWRQKYAGLGPSELKKLKQLEEENGQLRRRPTKARLRLCVMAPQTTTNQRLRFSAKSSR